MAIHHWFIPHKDTHKKARLITWQAMACYLLLFIILQVVFSLLGYLSPGILGTSSSITQARIIELTNIEREKMGLSMLTQNDSLAQAAEAKANNMFEENYWAHFSPSGKDPWGFMKDAGYRFSFAGENLAKNFTNSDEVIKAWMNSPSHKENIVNGRFRDIGIAVVDGVLDGQQTTLVVQMFGTSDFSNLAAAPQATPKPIVAQAIPTQSPTQAPIPTVAPTIQPIMNIGGEEIKVPPADLEEPARVITSVPAMQYSRQPLFDPFVVSRVLSLGLIGMIAFLIMLDFVILRRRGVFRVASHHFAHLALLFIVGLGIVTIARGAIL
jgi:hypothetical protein